MLSYEILKDFEKLTPAEQKDCMGYFLGGVGMHYEGFTFEHKDKPHAEYALKELQQAIYYAQNRAAKKDLEVGQATKTFDQ